MESFIIEGGHPLQGTITPQGAKNEAAGDVWGELA